MHELRVWKKVYESDLDNIIHEMRDVLSLPAVIILTGPVGAGKTTFTRAFVGAQDKDEAQEVSSPTYSLIQETKTIAYADFYRLQSIEDLVHLELDLYLEGKDYFLVEWGREYLQALKSHVSDDFLFYEMSLTINEACEQTGQADSRNITLYRLD
jgi:tRNA threonylcarbamoyladenosine biosynthesis protein TsaE